MVSPWEFTYRRGQPRGSFSLVKSYAGFQLGSAVLGALGSATDDGRPLTLGGSITRSYQPFQYFVGDATDNIAYARTDKTLELLTGGNPENPSITFVIVFRKQTTGVSSTSIAGFGATTGSGGSTLCRVMGGTSAVNLALQIQDSAGTSGYNTDLSTPVAVNDQRWHTAVITADLITGGNAACYVDGVAPASTSNISGNFTGNTVFDYVSVCGIVRGGSPLAYGDYDVALFVPIFGKLSVAQGKSLSSNPWQLFRPQINVGAVAEIAGGGGDVTEAITGVSSTGGVGSVTPSVATALTGNSATGAVGSLSPTVSNGVTGNEGTGSVGSVTPSVTVGITGVSATGAVGNVSAVLPGSVSISGVEATGSVGSVTPSASTALTGESATGQVGSVSAGTSDDISGVAGTGSVGSISPSVTVALSGVSAIGFVGDVVASGGSPVYTPTIEVTLKDEYLQPVAGLSGLIVSWWDEPDVSAQGAPDLQFTAQATDGSGKLSVTTLLGSSLGLGATGWIEITNSDGTTSQSPVAKVAAGPITTI